MDFENCTMSVFVRKVFRIRIIKENAKIRLKFTSKSCFSYFIRIHIVNHNTVQNNYFSVDKFVMDNLWMVSKTQKHKKCKRIPILTPLRLNIFSYI